MTASVRLRQLADRATPAFPNRWRSMNEEPPRVAVLAPAGVWVDIPYDEADARLIALAPDLARWAADAADYLERRRFGEDIPPRVDALLARLDELTGDTG